MEMKSEEKRFTDDEQWLGGSMLWEMHVFWLYSMTKKAKV